MRGGKVLLVDDSEHGRAGLARRLKGHGYEVEEAHDGPEALSRVRQVSYDLVLLDQMMPGMSGLEVLRRLRGAYSQSELPVILLTGVHEAEFIAHALRSGANDYVSKPADALVVAARIQSQIARCESERASRTTDWVTGMGNRQLIVERIAALSRTREDRYPGVSIVLLSLDRFQEISVSFNCALGDTIVREAAQRLQASLEVASLAPDTYLAARIGGGDFVVLLDHLAVDECLRLAQAFSSELRAPIVANGFRHELTASAGIVHERRRDYTAEDLIEDADLAARLAREKGGARIEVFDLTMRERVRTHMSVAMGLTGAIERGELFPVYQPEVDLRTGEITGFECLLRWQRPGSGCLPPAEFIPTAEQTNLIVPIGAWLTQQACRQLAHWQSRFPRETPLTMNVNLSARQLSDPDLVPGVNRALAEWAIPPSTLGFELTETALATDIQSAEQALRNLRDLGVAVKLDDFGTGYSSLSYLRNFRFDSIKVDRSFVSRMASDPETRAIVSMIVHLAGNLGMTVVAEGIENRDQLEAARSAGCDTAQGYYFARPLEKEGIELLLARGIRNLDSERVSVDKRCAT